MCDDSRFYSFNPWHIVIIVANDFAAIQYASLVCAKTIIEHLFRKAIGLHGAHFKEGMVKFDDYNDVMYDIDYEYVHCR